MSQKQRNYNRKQTQKSKKQRRQSSEIHNASDLAIEKIRDNYRYLRCKYKNIFFILIWIIKWILSLNKWKLRHRLQRDTCGISEKLRPDLMKAVPGTTEYDSISSMIELQQRISAVYIRLEENLKGYGLRQITTSALGVCLFMASALSMSPLNEDIDWHELLLGTIDILKQSSHCNVIFKEHL